MIDAILALDKNATCPPRATSMFLRCALRPASKRHVEGGPVLPSFNVPLGGWPESASQEHRGGARRTCRVLVQCQDRVDHPSGARVDGATRRRQISVRLRRVALAGGGDGRRAGSVARSRSVSARSLPRGTKPLKSLSSQRRGVEDVPTGTL